MSIPVFENQNLGVCGVMNYEGEEVILYSNPENGDILYYEETSGRNMLIGQITDRTAKQGMNKDALFKALTTGSYGQDAMGVVFCEKHVIVLTSESTCEIRPYNALKVPSDKKFDIQLGIDADE